MKDIMNIAVVNFATEWGNKQSNLKRILEYCEAAGKRGADFIVFPETALSGYDTDKDHPQSEMMHTKLAETIPGPSTEKVAEMAERYGMYIVFGMPEKENDAVYNSAAIIEPDGKTYAYRKIHLPFDEAEWAEPGNEPVLIPTPWGPVGITICYDTYCFPELIRYYRSMGASLTLNVTACPDAPCTEGSAVLTIPAYAFVNYIYIASANLCGLDKYNNFIGGSSVVGPDKSGGNVKTYVGRSFSEEGRDEVGMKFGTIDLSLADQYAQIPIFRRDENGRRDFRGNLYAKLYSESELESKP